jgi:hypothetical protein
MRVSFELTGEEEIKSRRSSAEGREENASVRV